MQALAAIEARRRTLRIILFIIILATLPFYCVGIVLWISAPQSPSVRPLSTSTLPPAQATTLPGLLVSPTPLGGGTGFVTATRPPALPPTPGQFIPPVVPPAIIPPTRFLTATPPPLVITATFPGLIIPTLAPTLTPIPSLTPIPVTNTPIPLPTETPIPVLPTNTFPPPPDSDGDGIPDNLDVCPAVPAPGTLDGCPPPTVFVAPTTDPLAATPIPPGS